MGREHKKRRRMKIRQKQKRQKKLAKLREKYLAANMDSERKEVLEKVYKIAPWLTKEKFLEPIKDQLEK
jgi:hypothetical protein